MTSPNAQQIEDWNDRVGQTWVRFAESLDRQLEPIGLAAMDRLDLRQGSAVLEVGCGTGAMAVELARRTGRSGRVLGCDVSDPMLALARERTRAAGLAQVELIRADAQTYAFPAGAFDALYSRFGVMFFEDPAAAFANLRRAVRPGGGLAFACWRSAEENPWMTLSLKAAEHLLPEADEPPLAEPPKQGPFAFADRALVERILAAGGWRDVLVEPLDLMIGGSSLDDATAIMSRVGPLGARLRQAGAPPELIAAVEPAVREALQPHLTDAGVMLPSASWIVTARA